MSPLSPGDRTDTGTVARRVLPFVGSPRCAKSSCTPPATAVKTTSFTVPPRESLIFRNTSNGRSAVAKRRLGPTLPSNGPRGGVPIPATMRRASAVAVAVCARIHGCLTTWVKLWTGCKTDLLDGVEDRALRRAGASPGPCLFRHSERHVGREIEQRRPDHHPRRSRLPSRGAASTGSRFGPPARLRRRRAPTAASYGRAVVRPTRPTARSSSNRPPGDGTAERRRWKSKSNRSSSTQTGLGRCRGPRAASVGVAGPAGAEPPRPAPRRRR